MPSQSNGLRFDIYERVHLPDEVAAIHELEEIELVPRIGIVQQDEQVLLKGHLLLTGVYRSDERPLSEQSLEHWIPVEITLPLNRIHRLDDIAVEIDNFDVDVLSTRTLNITGVLSLFGIEIEQASPQESWQREEPFTVVHKRDENDAQQAAPYFTPQPQVWTAEQQRAAEQQAQQQWAAEQQRAAEQQAQQQWAAEQQRAAEQHAQQQWAAEQQRAAEQQTQQQWGAEQHAQYWTAEQQQLFAAQTESLEASEALARTAQAVEQELLLNARQERENEEAARQEAARQGFGSPEVLTEIEQQEFSQPEAQPEAQHAVQPEVQPVEARALEQPSYLSEFEAFETESDAYAQAEAAQQHRQQEPAVIAVPEATSSFSDVTVVDKEAQRKELRVGLSGKSAEEEAAQQGTGNVNFRSILQSSRREQEAKAAAEQNALREAALSRKTSGDEIEWKNLFYGRPSDEHAFRKVRICIVQREETLEAIAGRYQLQAREIAQHNRLQDQNVSEGQVLYIP